MPRVRTRHTPRPTSNKGPLFAAARSALSNWAAFAVRALLVATVVTALKCRMTAPF